MHLSTLLLQSFRNYQKRSFRFDKKTTLIVGSNGSGKTNILEALYVLATGTSFRAQRIEEMIKFNEELARISSEVVRQGGRTTLEIMLTRGQLQGKRVAKRRYSVEGVSKRVTDFVGRVVVVLFRPEDLQLILGSPVKRRTFLDEVLVQVEREYRRSLVSYEKALSRRNKLLDAIREGETARSQLAFWDKLLIKHGQILTQRRTDFIEFINSFNSEINSFRVVYDGSAISSRRLEQYAAQEVALGYTLVGPHKDDFLVKSSTGRRSSKSRELARYGARGEQRLAILWLKLAALAFVSEKIGESPVLLLDDIFSELDEDHRQMVLKVVEERSRVPVDARRSPAPNGAGQTIITTSDLGLIESKYMDSLSITSLD